MNSNVETTQQKMRRVALVKCFLRTDNYDSLTEAVASNITKFEEITEERFHLLKGSVFNYNHTSKYSKEFIYIIVEEPIVLEVEIVNCIADFENYQKKREEELERTRKKMLAEEEKRKKKLEEKRRAKLLDTKEKKLALFHKLKEELNKEES